MRVRAHSPGVYSCGYATMRSEWRRARPHSSSGASTVTLTDLAPLPTSPSRPYGASSVPMRWLSWTTTRIARSRATKLHLRHCGQLQDLGDEHRRGLRTPGVGSFEAQRARVSGQPVRMHLSRLEPDQTSSVIERRAISLRTGMNNVGTRQALLWTAAVAKSDGPTRRPGPGPDSAIDGQRVNTFARARRRRTQNVTIRALGVAFEKISAKQKKQGKGKWRISLSRTALRRT